MMHIFYLNLYNLVIKRLNFIQNITPPIKETKKSKQTENSNSNYQK